MPVWSTFFAATCRQIRYFSTYSLAVRLLGHLSGSCARQAVFCQSTAPCVHP